MMPGAGSSAVADVAFGVDIGGPRCSASHWMPPAPWWPRRAWPTPTGPGRARRGRCRRRRGRGVAQLDAAMHMGSAGSSGGAPPVGVGAPGMVDHAGPVSFRARSPRGQGVDSSALIGERLTGRRVVIENDANFAVLAELRLGAAKDFAMCLMVTFGAGSVAARRRRTGAGRAARLPAKWPRSSTRPGLPVLRAPRLSEHCASGGGLGVLAPRRPSPALPGVVALSGGDPESVRSEDVTRPLSRRCRHRAWWKRWAGGSVSAWPAWRRAGPGMLRPGRWAGGRR